MYLLDTNILSETRRVKPHGAVLAWMVSVDATSLYLPAVVVGEIQMGIEKAASTNPGKAIELSRWLDGISQTSQVLSADADIFRIWAKFVQRINSSLIVDALIAATAIRHNMAVVTRNVRDFQSFDVVVLNPFEHKM